MGTLHLALKTLTGKPLSPATARSRTEEKRAAPLRTRAPPRCTCSPLRAPSRPLPHPHAGPAPPGGAAASPRPREDAGQHRARPPRDRPGQRRSARGSAGYQLRSRTHPQPPPLAFCKPPPADADALGAASSPHQLFIVRPCLLRPPWACVTSGITFTYGGFEMGRPGRRVRTHRDLGHAPERGEGGGRVGKGRQFCQCGGEEAGRASLALSASRPYSAPL